MGSQMQTREKLLDTARREFLKKGYDGVTIRALTRTAGVNIASVNYHFKGKKDLYREFFKQRLQYNTERKVSAIESLFSNKNTPTLHDVIHTYVSLSIMDMTSSDEARQFLKLMSQEISERGVAVDIIFSMGLSPVHDAMLKAIKKVEPKLDSKSVSLGIFSIISQVFNFVRGREYMSKSIKAKSEAEFLDASIRHITDFSIKGLGR
jgi:AcrR family transcriptional regulator